MEPPKDEDVIIIHLGRVLTDEQYQEVLDSVLAFMKLRWPNHCAPNEFSN